MSTALNTTDVYIVDSEPTWGVGEPRPEFTIGDRVKIADGYGATPDIDGDVFVTAIGLQVPDERTVRYMAAKHLRPFGPDDFKVGDRVGVVGTGRYPDHRGKELEIMNTNPSVRDYGVGPVGGDRGRPHSGLGWYTYNRDELELLTPVELVEAAAPSTPTVNDFKPGDRVRVAADAKMDDWTRVWFGREVEAEVIASRHHLENVLVRGTDVRGDVIEQFVAQQFLTKITEPAHPVEAAPATPALSVGDIVKVSDVADYSGGVDEEVHAARGTIARMIESRDRDGDVLVRTVTGSAPGTETYIGEDHVRPVTAEDFTPGMRVRIGDAPKTNSGGYVAPSLGGKDATVLAGGTDGDVVVRADDGGPVQEVAPRYLAPTAPAERPGDPARALAAEMRRKAASLNAIATLQEQAARLLDSLDG